jgi:hypothetical protein
MIETVVLKDGTLADLYFSHEMWRADVNGVHYCAPDLEILYRIVHVVPQVEPEPIRPLSELLYEKLRKGTLEEKQSARQQLIDLVKNGDESAIQYLDKLPDTPVSRNARYITMVLGKEEFEKLTFADLSANVPDLVLRNKLMSELESRFKLDASDDQ